MGDDSLRTPSPPSSVSGAYSSGSEDNGGASSVAEAATGGSAAVAAAAYCWQGGDEATRMDRINARREELLAMDDLATSAEHQQEWMSLLAERARLSSAVAAVYDGASAISAPVVAAASNAAATLANLPPLQGWLMKRRGTSGRSADYVKKWFSFDNATGRLCQYDRQEAGQPTGYAFIVTTRSIETDDPEARRFKINLPERTWSLVAEDPAEMIMWMDELLLRKQVLTDARSSMTAPPSPAVYDSEDEDTGRRWGRRRRGRRRGSSTGRGEAEDEGDEGPSFNPGDMHISESVMVPSPVRVSRSTLFAGDASVGDAGGSTGTATDTAAGDEHAKPTKRVGSFFGKGACEACPAHEARIKTLEQQLAAKDETLALVKAQLVANDRELQLKDETLDLLQSEIDSMREAQSDQLQIGLSMQELQQRLILSQSELAHTRALVDLYNHRLAGAMELAALYQSMVDGAAVDPEAVRVSLQEQLERAQQACMESDERSKALQEELELVRAASLHSGGGTNKDDDRQDQRLSSRA